MNSTGHRGEKTGYLVILLLVVGLLSFSSAMKELSQLHQLALDASSMVAHWSSDKVVAPAKIPVTVAKLETCETAKAWAQSVPPVELPWLDHVAQEKTIEVKKIERPVVERTRRMQVTRSNRVRRVDFDPVQVEVRVSADHDAEPEAIMAPELPQFSFKTKTRKHNVIRINSRDREMLLKTLNRSINLRIAS